MVEKNTHVGRWIENELSFWSNQHPNTRALNDFSTQINLSDPGIVLLEIINDRVTLVDKPGLFKDNIIINRQNPISVRAMHYQKLLLDVIYSENLPNHHLRLIFNLKDYVEDFGQWPVFSFQKPIGSNNILVPDIDFLVCRFYEKDLPPGARDLRDYKSKDTHATFVGSTTGRPIIDAHAVRALSIPRLRAANFFRESAIVDFRLPRIVQCESATVEAMIRDANLAGGPRISWEDQLKSKFIISMDGNGATCSRVAVALRSNSALIKYDSPHQLFYFSSLEPWRHFIPVSRDEDVPAIVEQECRDPGHFASIAEQSKVFAMEQLSRKNIYAYMAALIRGYAELVTVHWAD
ncbi:MAG TPA: glycosyl transferase family 90 [Stellaceae bacterium]|jgi:hypothetical protein|nr:glycosyl transferase family 90 [Stellaceae bacterium]